jgi:putative heme-binding domain-containing protein
MYRKVIDHPQYLPEAVRAHADFDAGKDKGRIYRIVPKNSSTKELVAARKPRLDRATVPELCAALNHPNGWVRATAFRLLLQRKDKSTIPLLKSLARDARSLPQTRLAAIRLLDNLGSLQLEMLQAGLSDTHPGVRQQAIHLSQARLRDSPQLLESVRRLGDDPDPGVRFQCALALGEVAGPSNVKVLATIAARDGADRWSRAAVLSSIGNEGEDFLKAFMEIPAAYPEAIAAVMIDLSRIFGLSLSLEKCLALFNEITQNTKGSEAAWQAAAVVGMVEGLHSRGFSKPGVPVLTSLVSVDSMEGRRALLQLKELSKQARKTACRDDAQIGTRLSSIALVGEAGENDSGAILLSLITPKEPTEVQVAAVRACGQLDDQELLKVLVTRERWRGYLPSVREAVLATLISERRYLSILFDALERGDIQTWSLEPARRNLLMQNKDEALRARAVALFRNQGSEDRQKVYDDYKSVLSLPATAKNGHEVFKRVCTQCHTHHGEGVAVGPDLTGMQNQPAEALILHILIPSYEIVPGYTSYDVETKDGRLLSGLIASESATSITLKRSMGVMDSILRDNIASISSTGLSLMPDELEKTMTRQELADLIAFLKGQDSLY